MPVDWLCKIQPISINFTDQEKVIALVKDKANDLCVDYVSKQMFAFAIKIFPFTNKVCSCHIVIMRIERAKGGNADEEEHEINVSPGKGKGKGREREF